MVTRQERSRKRKFVAGWKIQGKRNRDDLWHRYTLQVAIDWSYSRSWDAENRSNVWFVDWQLWLRMASKIRCKRIRRKWSRNPTEDGARPGVSSTFDDVLRVNPFYYSSPFKRSKADDVFPRYYRGGSRENFGTWHGWEIVSLRGFCLDCWFRSREKWWLLIRLGRLKNLPLYLFDNLIK